MPSIHVCPLSQIPATVAASGARSLLTLINDGTPVVRPGAIAAQHHLNLAMSDIVLATAGEILPARAHVEEIIAFARRWDREAPLVVHCYAGVSRSTAAAFIAACAIDPARDEDALAREIRAASPTATPNALMVEIADAMLERDGRMIAAIRKIGRGADCFEGTPFSIAIGRAA